MIFLDPLPINLKFILRHNMMNPIPGIISLYVSHLLVNRIEPLDHVWAKPFLRAGYFLGDALLDWLSWIVPSILDRIADVVVFVTVNQEAGNILLVSLVCLSWYRATNKESFFRNFRKGILMVSLALLWSYYWKERVSLFTVAIMVGSAMGFLLN